MTNVILVFKKDKNSYHNIVLFQKQSIGYSRHARLHEIKNLKHNFHVQQCLINTTQQQYNILICLLGNLLLLLLYYDWEEKHGLLCYIICYERNNLCYWAKQQIVNPITSGGKKIQKRAFLFFLVLGWNEKFWRKYKNSDVRIFNLTGCSLSQ